MLQKTCVYITGIGCNLLQKWKYMGMYLGVPPYPFHVAPGNAHLSPGDSIDMGVSHAVNLLWVMA